jgi:3-isopropylmalate/(R)-2-methylmalate dehydratase small subunit
MKSFSSARWRGRAWTFGHELALDDDVMALRFTLLRETDGDVLKAHLFERLDPAFARAAQPGDLIVAGRRFGHGNPHIPAFIAMRALGVGLLTESMPRGTLRSAVYMGVPILPACPGLLEHVGAGDTLEVDFETGAVVNVTRATTRRFPPLAPPLLDLIRRGGARDDFKARVAAGAR